MCGDSTLLVHEIASDWLMTRSIAGEIGIKVMSQEQTRLASTRSVNPDAYEAYLKGMYYASEWSEEGFRKSVARFHQAIEVDPTYAPSYGGWARCIP
jgi:hypothetical protein